jgi:hypothetical protein
MDTGNGLFPAAELPRFSADRQRPYGMILTRDKLYRVSSGLGESAGDG